MEVIKDNDFAAVKEQDFAVVDFSATWCGPCKMLAPVLHEIADECTDGTAFYNVDVDENDQLAAQFGIMNVPTILFLKKGEVVGKSVGFLPKPQLEAAIAQYRG